MTFQKELDFEQALIELLSHKGWEQDVLKKSHRRSVNQKLGEYPF